jgi:hypothetical protein
MISRKEVNDLQVETYCRRRGIKLCKTWEGDCECIYIEPVALKNARGEYVVDCAACAPLCKKCKEPYNDSNSHSGVCWDCQTTSYSGFISSTHAPPTRVPTPVYAPPTRDPTRDKKDSKETKKTSSKHTKKGKKGKKEKKEKVVEDMLIFDDNYIELSE